tara:strand:- start:146 stop:400 length:255 start_codon:yes stop_codon:yes gene_type:complete
MELIAKPSGLENWKWDETDESRSTSQNGHSDFKTHVGGYAWTATISGSAFEYSSQSDAETKLSELNTASNTAHGGRRFKIVETA